MEYNNYNDVGRPQISSREILTVIFRRKVPILLCAIIVAASALMAASRTTSIHVATVKVLLRRMGATALATTWTPFYGLEEEMNTEVEIVSTPSVLQRALDILKEKGVMVTVSRGDSVVTRQPTMRDLMGGVSAQPVEMSNVMLIKYRGGDPNFAAEAAEAAAQAYVEHRVLVRKAGGIEEFFQEQLRQTEQRLIELKEHELQLRREGEVYDLEYQQTIMIRNKGEFELRLGETRSERIAEERKLQSIRRRLEENPDLLLPFAEFAGDKLVMEMLTSYWNVRSQRDERASILTEKNPEVRMLDDRLEKMKKRFHDEVERRMQERQFYIEDLKAQEAGLERAIEDVSEQLRQTPEVVARIEHIQKQIFYSYTHYDHLLSKMLETVVSEANDTRVSNAKVISGADVSATRAGKMKSFYVIFSILLGVTFGIGFGFLLESLDHSIKSADDVEDTLGVPVLGSIPDSEELADMTHRVGRLD